MKRERLKFFGILGSGWYTRVTSRNVTRTVRIEVFYR